MTATKPGQRINMDEIHKEIELQLKESKIAALRTITDKVVEAIEEQGFTIFELLETIENVLDERHDFDAAKAIRDLISHKYS